ncbi:mannanase [Clostridium acetobutylicum]|nr:mannanase [Clostridium acetobutylicum]
MTFNKRKRTIISLLATTLILSPLVTNKVYAVPTTCTSGAFLGWGNNLDNPSIMNDAAYTGKVNIVSFDLATFNNANYEGSISGDSAAKVAPLGKDTIISAEMPNPAGGDTHSDISDQDFATVANTKIQDINTSSSLLLQNYKTMISRIGDEIYNYHQKLNTYNANATIYYRPFHEMNASWFWWGEHDSNQFKQLWINIHDYLVNTRGLSWLKFCYSANESITTDSNVKDALDYYPGGQYVDNVGLDGYSDDPENDGDVKKTYAELVGGTYNGQNYQGLGKPFGFTELGPKVGGDYVDNNNRQIRPFDYQKLSNAIEKNYPKAGYSIVFDGAYDPRNNIHGTSLFNGAEKEDGSLSYDAHVQNIGWQSSVSDGDTAGTVGQGLRMEAIKINYNNNLGLHLHYQTHVQNYGWMSEVKDGELAGTTGQSLRTEAIKIMLKDSSGNNASNYSVYYRTQVENIGWTPWKKNGDVSGTTGKGLRMESLQIYVVKNGTGAAQAMEKLIQSGK